MQVADLLDVIYTAGTVFDGLSTSRPATDAFLRTGDTTGVRGRGDLALLEDLRDAAEIALDCAGSRLDSRLDAAALKRINAAMTRSAALNPGKLRTAAQGIGVRTPLGRFEPPEIDEAGLDALITQALNAPNDVERAIELFLRLAKAQPFEDGNKRTAILAANAFLIGSGSDVFLTVPFDDNDPATSSRFNEMLARWYLRDELTGVKVMLLQNGPVPAPAQ